VAVGVAPVGGPGGEVQPRDDDEAVEAVGGAVDRLGADRDAPGGDVDCRLREE